MAGIHNFTRRNQTEQGKNVGLQQFKFTNKHQDNETFSPNLYQT